MGQEGMVSVVVPDRGHDAERALRVRGVERELRQTRRPRTDADPGLLVGIDR
jgi:hypothetical protein